jgi:hypothetical protein
MPCAYVTSLEMRPRSQSVIIIYNAAARGETTSPCAHAANAHTQKGKTNQSIFRCRHRRRNPARGKMNCVQDERDTSAAYAKKIVARQLLLRERREK